MSYTLRGRIESRLAAAALPVLAACLLSLVLERWWPLELAGAMVGAGLALDLAYDRFLAYQPGWAALPLGVLELGATMGLARMLDVAAPVGPAIWFFAASWLVAQLWGHAGFPLLRLTYAEDGGELGQGGTALLLAAPVVLLVALGTAAATQPPTVVLEPGVHQGPLVLDHEQTLVGEPGAIVKGGIVVTADHVTIRHVTVMGGDNGIDVEEAEHVRLDDVTIVGARLDGIHARRSSVSISDCRIDSPAGYTQGIDISFSADLDMSMVEGCTITGGREGIVTNSARADISHNHVTGTDLRAITMMEMSMGAIERNEVIGVRGAGVYCGDRSMCEIERNTIVGVASDVPGDVLRGGVGIVSFFESEAELDENEIADTPRKYATFMHSSISHKR
jgi:nitrous oxidase accessory protein NosD